MAEIQSIKKCREAALNYHFHLYICMIMKETFQMKKIPGFLLVVCKSYSEGKRKSKVQFHRNNVTHEKDYIHKEKHIEKISKAD